MSIVQTVPIRWKLKPILEQHEIRTRDLAAEIAHRGGKTKEVTLYRITGRSRQITPKGFDVLEDVILGLEGLTGKTFTPNDLIEVVRNAP